MRMSPYLLLACTLAIPATAWLFRKLDRLLPSTQINLIMPIGPILAGLMAMGLLALVGWYHVLIGTMEWCHGSC